MENPPNALPVILPNGQIIQVQVSGSRFSDEGDVADESDSSVPRTFDDVVSAIEGIAQSVSAAFKSIRPNEAVVEFGVEVAAESGKLTALLVKGGGKASLKVTLKWEFADSESETPESNASAPREVAS